MYHDRNVIVVLQIFKIYNYSIHLIDQSSEQLSSLSDYGLFNVII